MMIELQDWVWDMPKENRHDVFLPQALCVKIEHANFMQPITTVIDWLDDQKLDYCIHSPWADGCSFYIMKPSDAELIVFKLIFPEASVSKLIFPEASVTA